MTKADVFRLTTPEMLIEARKLLIGNGKTDFVDHDHSIFVKGVWAGMEILAQAIALSSEIKTPE